MVNDMEALLVLVFIELLLFDDLLFQVLLLLWEFLLLKVFDLKNYVAVCFNSFILSGLALLILSL